MTKYIGIHCGQSGYAFVEFVEEKNRNEAYENMERNDTHLTLLTFKEYKKIHKKVIKAFANQE